MLERVDLPCPVPVRRLTDSAAGFHWFGYYDKLETSPDGRPSSEPVPNHR